MQRVLDFHQNGHIAPLAPRKTIEAVELSDAVSGAHTWTNPGKVVLLMPDQPNIPLAYFKDPLRFRTDRAYLIVGNSGKTTRPVATWLVERGAKHIVFFCGSNEDLVEDERFDVELTSMECATVRISGDLTDGEDIIRAIRSMEIPFAGVLYLTGASKVFLWRLAFLLVLTVHTYLTNTIFRVGYQRAG